MIKVSTMPNKNATIEKLIHGYLLEEGVFKNKLINDKFDFGFVISFQPGSKIESLSVYKPKNMNCIFITIRFKISKEKISALDSFKDNRKLQFLNSLRKYLLIKEVYFKFDYKEDIIEIHEQIYPDQENFISKEALFKLIQKVFYCFLFSNQLLDEYCTKKKIPKTELGFFF
jgi:hypothetical protein